MTPPDPDFVTQYIQRIHYQVLFWNQCNKQIMECLSFKKKEWTWCRYYEIVQPVWC